MKHRFIMTKQNNRSTGFFVSIAAFVLVACLFVGGVNIVSDRNDDRKAEILKTALNSDILRCYTLEGSYPESLDHIIENYGLVYDQNRFFIDYHAQGKNVFPDYTIIDLEEKR